MDRDDRPIERFSHGMEIFFRHLGFGRDLHVLDLGTLSEGTAESLGQLGHHLHFANLASGYDEARPKLVGEDGEVSPRAVDRFVRMQLDYPPRSFHAVLAWDVLQQLDKPTMRSTIARLAKIMRTEAVIFCLFQTPDEHGAISVLNCDACSKTSFSLREIDHRPARNVLNPSDIELEFLQFRTVHFFLKRDSLLEVLVLS